MNTSTFECPICFEEKIISCKPPCGHKICLHCTNRMVVEMESKCAYCRAPLPQNSLDYTYEVHEIPENVTMQEVQDSLPFASGDVDIFQKLLDLGADVFDVGMFDMETLDFCIHYANVDTLNFLLKKFPTLIKEKQMVKHPFLNACRQNNLEIVRALVNHKINVFQSDEFGLSALHYATIQGNVKIMQYLVEECKLNIFQTDNFGTTCIHLAAHFGNTEILQFLISKNVNVNAQSLQGSSPLHITILKNQFECMNILLNNGANINILNLGKFSPLLLAAKENHFEFAKILIERGADINVKNIDEKSVLYYAVENKNFEFVKFLLEQNVEIHVSTNPDLHPLLLCAWKNCVDIAKILIQFGADVNHQNFIGMTPFFISNLQQNHVLSETLKSMGADETLEPQINSFVESIAQNPSLFLLIKEVLDRRED